jgi:phosphohistidine phosphatase
MKYLTVIRHAKSDWSTGVSDHERPLNERGLRNAPVVARFLGRTYLGMNETPALLPRPERLVTSTAMRARTTARIMQEELGYNPGIVVEESRVYLAEAKTLLAMVREFDDAWSHVMLFGHNDGLSDFVRKLLQRDHLGKSMPTCAAALLEIPWPSWAAVDWNEARLVGYVTPRLIEKRFPESESVGEDPKPAADESPSQ